jgi:dipeptide transport system permease protein
MTDHVLVAAPPGPLREFWSHFRENAGAVAGLAVIVVLLVAALLAPWLAPHPPAEQYRDALLLPPAWLAGGSLLIGCIVVTLSLAAGVILGLVAGFFRGAVETLIMRLMDIMLALPSLLLAIAIVAVLGPSLTNAMIAIAVVVLPHYVRLTRASVIAETAKDYVMASQVAGAGLLRQMFVTVLPNCLAPLIVQATLGFSAAILEAAALGFLGLGAQPPTPEWGTMLADAREFIRSNPWWVVTSPAWRSWSPCWRST